jgi:hypothetical protein
MRRKPMNEEEYYASEFSDTELDSVADAGEFFLEESGFYYLGLRIGTVKNSANRLTAVGPALARIEGTVMAPEARNTVSSLDFDMGLECNIKAARTTIG